MSRSASAASPEANGEGLATSLPDNEPRPPVATQPAAPTQHRAERGNPRDGGGRHGPPRSSPAYNRLAHWMRQEAIWEMRSTAQELYLHCVGPTAEPLPGISGRLVGTDVPNFAETFRHGSLQEMADGMEDGLISYVRCALQQLQQAGVGGGRGLNQCGGHREEWPAVVGGGQQEAWRTDAAAISLE